MRRLAFSANLGQTKQMTGEQQRQPRRDIRLPDACYRDQDTFLLTICTAQRRPVFQRDELAKAAFDALPAAADKTGADLWCAVVMPDHVHLLVTAASGKTPLHTGSCFKRLATVALRKAGFTEPVWQRRIHDRGLRTNFGGDLLAAVRYVLENPVRHDLTSDWEAWPYTFVHPDLDAFL